MRKIFTFLSVLALVCAFSVMPVQAGINDRFSDIELTENEYILFPEILAPSGNPTTNDGWLYVKADGATTQLYFENDAGTVTAWGGSTAWDDLVAPDANESLDMTTFTTTWDFGGVADMFTLEFTGNFADVSGMVLEQKTGNPTDGTLLELKLADNDPDFLSFYNTTEKVNIDSDGVLTLKPTGSPAATLIFTPVGACTTAILITDDDYTNSLSIADNNIIGTTPTINFTDFDVSADGAITLACDDGGTAITITPSAAIIGIDATDANITTALDVAANDIVGTTGLINFTHFDVAADGDVTCVDLTASGAVSVGIFKQDALVPSTAAPHTITIDGAGAGGVNIGSTSTGNITLGDDVVVSDTYDVLIGEGKLTIDQDQNESALVITDAHTDTGSAIEVIADTTSGKTVSLTADSLTGGTILYLDATEGGPFTGYYIQAYDGAANDFAVKRHGEVEITGSSTADMITISAGDLQIDDGIFEVNTDEDVTSYIERAQATVTGHLLSLIEQTDTVASSKSVLFIDQDTDSTPSSALEIDTEGAYAIKIDALIATGDGIYLDVADSYVGQWFIADAGPWLGTVGEGFWSFTSDGAGTSEVGQVIRIDLNATGVDAAAISGKGLYIEDEAAATAGSYLVHLDSLANGAIHISNAGVASDGIKFDVSNAYAGQGIVADLAEHIGTVNEGFINIETDGAATPVVGQILRINLQDTLVDVTAISGKAIYAKEVSPFKDGTFLAHLESTNNGSLVLIGEADISAAPLLGASPIALEGATRDGTNIVTLAVLDPTSATTISIPDAATSSDMGVTLATGGTTTTRTGTGVATVTGSSIAIPAGHAGVGQVYKWEMAGTKSAANAAMSVNLKLDATEVMSLTASDATNPDWVARFTLWIVDNANQKIFGELLVNGKVAVTDYATGAVNIAGAINFFTEIESGNAGDNILCEMVNVYYTE